MYFVLCACFAILLVYNLTIIVHVTVVYSKLVIDFIVATISIFPRGSKNGSFIVIASYYYIT